MKLNRSTAISHDEIVAWAYSEGTELPENANANVWDLMLLDWFADPALYVNLAADGSCPKRRYFLALLRRGLLHRCSRTAWLAGTSEHLLQGLSPAHPQLTKHKGRGKKEKTRLKEELAASVHEEAAEKARAYAQRLSLLLEQSKHGTAELKLLDAKLTAFLSDPSTVRDDYWNCTLDL